MVLKSSLCHLGKMRSVGSGLRHSSPGHQNCPHTNGTAMDSLGIPQQIRKQRLGHSSNGMTEGYTHTFTQDERVAAEKTW